MKHNAIRVNSLSILVQIIIMVYDICIDFWFGFGLAFGCCAFLIWVRVTRLRMYKRTKCGVSLYLHSKHFYPFDILDTMTLEEKREVADKLDSLNSLDLIMRHLDRAI